MSIHELKEECKSREIKTRTNSRQDTLIKKLEDWEKEKEDDNKSISSDSSSDSLCLNENITGTVVLEERQEEDASHMDESLAADDGDKCNDNHEDDNHPLQQSTLPFKDWRKMSIGKLREECKSREIKTRTNS